MFRNFVESSRVRLLSGRWPPWDWWPALLATRGGRNTATAPQPTTTTSQSLPQSSTHILNLPTPASSWITCLRTHISLHAPCSTGRAGPCCSAACTSLGHPLTSSGVTSTSTARARRHTRHPPLINTDHIARPCIIKTARGAATATLSTRKYGVSSPGILLGSPDLEVAAHQICHLSCVIRMKAPITTSSLLEMRGCLSGDPA